MPYVEQVRYRLGDDKPALVVMDNFKGQITESVTSLLDTHDIHVCLLPPNTTDRLQPMDIAVNKPAKDYLKRQFAQWYSDKVQKQLEGQDITDLETLELQPIDLSLPALKEIGAKWLVDRANYISENPQFIVNGFIHSGITGALDGTQTVDSEDQLEFQSNSDDSAESQEESEHEEET